jgi:hypothetical protein
MLGIKSIKEVFDQTFCQLTLAATYEGWTSQAEAREAEGQVLGQISTVGPVKLWR